MRIAFDLQTCQSGNPLHMQAMLELLRNLQQAAPQHTWLACYAQLHHQAHANDKLRAQLQGILPKSQIRAYHLPTLPATGKNDDWGLRCQHALREFFLREWQTDLLYLPWLATPEHGHPLLDSSNQLGATLPTVLHLLQDLPANITVAQDGASARWLYQQLPLLQQAQLLVTESIHAAQQLAQYLPAKCCLNLGPRLLAENIGKTDMAMQYERQPYLVLQQAAGMRQILRDLCDWLQQQPDHAWQIYVLDAKQDETELRAMVARCGLADDKLHFANDAALLQQARAFICHAPQQTQFALQAMRCGVQIVCAKGLAIDELLAAEASFDIGNLESFKHSLDSVLAPSPDAETLDALRERAAQQQWLNAAKDILAHLPSTVAPIANKPSALPAQRPRLAYVSPLPPQQSGIADYSAELIPQLALYYDVDLILDQETVSAGWIGEHFPQRNLAWFEQHAQQFDHVLYHFGNSPVHRHMFALAARFPGVIVLHDFYLGNVLDYLHHTGYQPHAFMRALYQSHGFTAIQDQQQIGMVPSIWKYPCNRSLLQQANGVIVHSAYPRQLANQWYGADFAKDWQVLPLLRGLPADVEGRQAARARFGFKEQDFVLCTYGLLGRTKNNLEILQAWLASPLASDPDAHLVFVGGSGDKEYARTLETAIRAANPANPIRLTGFVEHQDYSAWLQAADAAVQLRSNSRGETSAAVLDCLLYGLPTIINAHGSSAELPATVLLQLPEFCSETELAAAFTRLRQEPALRTQLAQAGLDYIQTQHAPERVGQEYHRALEHFAQHQAHASYQRLLDQVANLSPSETVAEEQWIALASAIAHNQRPQAPRQLFVDVSAMVQTDLKTGIQRVVRSILLGLLAAPPAGFRIEPVYTPGQGQPYYYARQYMQGVLESAPLGLADDPIHARHGDIFLGLDLYMSGPTQSRNALEEMQAHGVAIYFVVYDILPLLRPDVFPVRSDEYFGAWLSTIAELSDGLLCISRAVADEVHTWLDQHPPQRQTALQLGYFHLGADLHASAPSKGLPENAPQILEALKQRRSLLMVGTVEPRKGHTQALDAVEQLWQQGEDINLVIVGKKGWLVDQLASRLDDHAEKGRRLFWLAGISDEMLELLYQECSALLNPSEGEGFGLPLIEAAQHGMPMILRDLPVFIEVAGEYAHYFSGSTAEQLAQGIQAWLSLDAQGQAPQSKDMPWLTWAQSAEQVRTVLLADEWYRSWQGVR